VREKEKEGLRERELIIKITGNAVMPNLCCMNKIDKHVTSKIVFELK
jgi:hypothetical protein